MSWLLWMGRIALLRVVAALGQLAGQQSSSTVCVGVAAALITSTAPRRRILAVHVDGGNSNTPLPLTRRLGLGSAATSSSSSSSTVTDNQNGQSQSSESQSSQSQSNREVLDSLYPEFPRTWVPLASTVELDPDRPTPVQFLDQSYVIYRSSISNWVVLDNTCPHRLAPLSEGRIEAETGRLQCSYHGWTFDPDGSCQRIPQAKTQTEQVAIQNPRSCVASYTTCVLHDIVWIWPWKDDPLSILDDNDWRHPEGIMNKVIPTSSSSSSVVVKTYTRDLPYGWDTLVENLIDPAHIPFAHHGMQGSRNDAIPINMTTPTPTTNNNKNNNNDNGQAGFSFQWQDRTMGMLRKGTGEFSAPYLVNYRALFEQPNNKESTPPRPWELAVLCIPTKPGWSRVIVFSNSPDSSPKDDKQERGGGDNQVDSTSTITKKNKKKKSFSLVAALFKILPQWAMHLMTNKFFDSDLAFLHYQEKYRRPPQQQGATATTIMRGDARYFMPSECDRSIAALHGWIDQHAKSYIQQQATRLPMVITDRSLLFDRWGQHTSHCKVCQDALVGIQKGRRISQLVLAVSVGLGFRHWIPRLVAVACLGMLKLFNKVEGAFYKGEFKHYENH